MATGEDRVDGMRRRSREGRMQNGMGWAVWDWLNGLWAGWTLSGGRVAG